MPVQIPKRSPWTNQRLVLAALLRREAVTRFGRYKMGVVWMLTEPLVGVIVMGLLLGPIIGRTAPDMPYAFFVLNGFVMMRCFTAPMMAGINAVSSNRGLLVFPKVQPLDLMLARCIFELFSSLISFTVFCLVGMWLGVRLSLGGLHELLATFLLTWLTGSGIGMLLCVGSAYSPSTDKVLAFLKRPLIFISCVLAPLYTMPAQAREILLLNPLVHTVELSRKALFPFYHMGEVNFGYPTGIALIFFALGLAVFQAHRNFLTVP